MAPDTGLTIPAFNFAPSLATSGGVFSNVVGTITGARISLTKPENYNIDGKIPLFFYLTLTLEDGAVEEQAYSMGGSSADFFLPDPSGYSLVRNPSAADAKDATLKKNTPFMNFLGSLVECGIPEQQLNGSLKNLLGIVGFWTRKQFKIEGLPERPPTPGMPKRDPIGTLVLGRLDKNPFTGKGGAAAGTARVGAAAARKPATQAAVPAPATEAPQAAPAAPTAPSGGALNMEGVPVTGSPVEFLTGLLDANGGSVPVDAINGVLFTAIKQLALRNNIKKLLADGQSLEEAGMGIDEGALVVLQ